MAFIDEIIIHAKSGDGGNGVVRWRHEKGKEFSGASGGNGGKGGDVYVRAIRDIGILNRYKTEKRFEAGRGEDGMKDSQNGESGKDIFIDVPKGSVITDLRNNRFFSLLEEGQTEQILIGGRGGLGNEYFKASTNTTPKESTPGTNGEEGDFLIELELVADIGLIGFPNAGKSSLLNSLTRANVKVANYPFTTLEPNLGVLKSGHIMADIPGIIEGASIGKGLGHKFLRHIKRTKILLHCIPADSQNVVSDYEVIRNELEAYGKGLEEKPEIILITKEDSVGEDELKEKIKLLKKKNKKVESVSILIDESIKELQDKLSKILSKD